MSYLGCCAKLEAALECPQSIQGVIQRLIFLDSVRASGKQFPGPGYDRFLSFGDPSGNPVLVGLEESSNVKVSPALQYGRGSEFVSHQNTSTSLRVARFSAEI
jgi:hypothetical protein